MSYHARIRETVTSLRAYFLLAGVIGTLSSISSFNDAKLILDLHPPFQYQLAAILNVGLALILGIGFFIAGVSLTSALPTGARWIQKLLVGSIVALCVQTVLLLTLDGPIVTFGIGLLISLYLLASVRRLAKEAMAATAAPLPAAHINA